MENKKHFSQIDFIRTICAIGIIIYHYSSETKGLFKPLLTYANGDVGSVIVTVFFIVSGFVLYHNNSEIKSLKTFYIKRAKSIFPSFYICWFIFYAFNVIKVRTPFYAGSPIKLLLTLMGMDGYFSQRIITYYTVGEWFLGALIFAYLLYPILLKLIKKHDKLTVIILLVLVEFITIFNIPTISPGFPGIIESCLKLYIGMLIYKYKDALLNKPVLIVSFIFFIIYSVFKIDYLNVLFSTVYSISLFIILFFIGELFNNNQTILKIFSFTGSLTYQVFLCHHQLLLILIGLFIPGGAFQSFLLIFVGIIVCFAFAYMLNRATNIIMRLLSNKGYTQK